ncbi:MAG: hypothetical protein P8L85_19915 [Rubripirellula sp.]|nr:hypothetical protein [Rubripirellula sp.]
MSNERRTHDRRRRVLYSTHQTDSATVGDLARMREARQPSAVYGSRVHRRLRARWFSLVPVKRSSMALVASVIFAISSLLCLGHYASVSWPSIAGNPEISGPLRLDQPGSFGRWFMVMMLAGTAGLSFLIYQLRRHRNDDFAGRYRLWRTVLIVALLGSLQALVPIIDWSGALLDLAFGRRVALAGGDWVRLIVLFGGAILVLQMLAEIHRCRFAMLTLGLGIACWGIAVAVQWNVMEVTTIGRWVLVTATPLMASSAVFIATIAYLRMLYREVRQVEDSVSMRQRWQRMQQDLFDKDPQEEMEKAARAKSEKLVRQSKSETVEPSRRSKQSPVVQKQASTKDVEQGTSESETDTAEVKSTKRSWFRRQAKSETDRSSRKSESVESKSVESPAKPKKKRRFSLRLTPAPQQDEVSKTKSVKEKPGEQKQRGSWLKRKKGAEETDAVDVVDEDQSNKKSGRWWRRNKQADSDGVSAAAETEKSKSGGWLSRKKTAEKKAVEKDLEQEEAIETKRVEESSPEFERYDEAIDSEEIDWGSLSKSERRRLRKQLKRQNRAA